MAKIENIEWILAPMDGVTDCAYRSAWFAVFGRLARMKKAVSPFIPLTATTKITPRLLFDVLPQNNPCGMELEPQVLGNHAGSITAAARALADTGHTSVNWNLGCPKPQVARKQRGSGLLPHPDRIAAVLDEVCTFSPIPFSVKIRLGRQSAEEAPAVIETLNRYPLKYVAVHPRTGRQLYSGTANLNEFEKVLPLIKHPVIYNGDINSPEKAVAVAERFPQIKQIMIGRGVIANPFLPCILSGTDLNAARRKTLFIEFLHRLWSNYRQLYGEKTALQKQKLFWCNFASAPDGTFADLNAAGCFETVKHFETAAQYARFLDTLQKITV